MIRARRLLPLFPQEDVAPATPVYRPSLLWMRRLLPHLCEDRTYHAAVEDVPTPSPGGGGGAAGSKGGSSVRLKGWKRPKQVWASILAVILSEG